MNISDSDLRESFQQLCDEELLSRSVSGDLTVQAQTIIDRMLRTRGLTMPPMPTSLADDYQGDFEIVARFLSPSDAHVVCGCLAAAGMPARLADANLVQTNSLWAIAAGGVRVLVPASRLQEAQALIAAFDRGDFALPDDESPQE